MNDNLLDREKILRAFDVLAERMGRSGLRADVYVFGGGAIVLGFDERGSTQDIDSAIRSTDDVRRTVVEVAEELGLPRWWLNERATPYLPPVDDPRPVPVLESSHLRVVRASDEHLLAQKVQAARDKDLRDVEILVRHMGLRTEREVAEIVEQVYPGKGLTDRQQKFLGQCLARPT